MGLEPGTLIVIWIIYFVVDMCLAWVANILKPSLFFELGIRCFWSTSIGAIIALGMLGRLSLIAFR